MQEGKCAAGQAADVQASWEVVGGTFIVRFKQYKMAVEHRRSLEEGVGGNGLQWRWVDRQNRAALHPTDFGLLNINDADIDSAKACKSSKCSHLWSFGQFQISAHMSCRDDHRYF